MLRPESESPFASLFDFMIDFDEDLAPATRVGEYEIVSKLGEGAFGKVFRAIHPLIGKEVAIKVLARKYSADPQVVSRFVSEARAVNQIAHRNIIDIFAFGQLADGRQYYVMEYLHGFPLDRLLAERTQLGFLEALPILRGVARALDAAHKKGVAHRDLKPANIFVTDDPDAGPFPKLLDFGIAKLTASGVEPAHKTQTGAAMGTPYYMSPEQCSGLLVDWRTDIYSFGVMVFELLTGKPPFRGKGYVEILYQHIEHTPPRMSDLAPHLPREFDDPVMRMMAKRPDDRPQSLAEAMRELEAAALAHGMAVPSASSGELTSVTRARSVAPQDEAGRASQDSVRPAPLSSTMDSSIKQGEDETGDAPRGAWLQQGRRGRPLWAIGLAAGFGLVALAVWFATNQADPVTIPAVSLPIERPAPRQPVASGEAAAIQLAPPVVTPSVSRRVRLELSGRPDGAVVTSSRGAIVGILPFAIAVDESTDPLELTISAQGYRTSRRTIVPDKDVLLEIVLEPSDRKKPGRKNTRDDIEEAF